MSSEKGLGSASHLPPDDGRGDSTIFTATNIAIAVAAIVVIVIASLFAFHFKPWEKHAATPPASPAAVNMPQAATPPAALPQLRPALPATAPPPQGKPKAATASSETKTMVVKPRVSAVGRIANASGPCTPGDTGKPFIWKHAGGNPYAHSEKEALSDAKLDRMLACNGVPREDWGAIKAYLRDPHNGTNIALAPGDAVGNMMFGNGRMITNVIAQIPGGQRALEFSLTVNGRQYVFVLPLECWNWTLRKKVEQSDCVEIVFHHKYGKGIVHFGVGSATSAPMPKSNCDAYRQGKGPWKPFKPCSQCVPDDLGAFDKNVASYAYNVTDQEQTLRFSRAVLERLPYICLEDEAGVQTHVVYMPPKDWKGRTRVEIPDSMWILYRE